jgi:transcriptional regulator with XRE-family HTH domain
MYMKLNGKSRKDVAQALGVSYYTLTDWVNGKKFPRMDKVEMIANYFGIKKSDLIEKKSIENSPKEMAVFHAEILMDEDLMEMIGEYWLLEDKKKKIVKDLVHSLAETEV